MNTQQLINYATEKSMNYKTFTDEFTGRFCVGIEWKNNDVYYWYFELSDGDLFFYERYSRNNGTSSGRFSMTECNIRKSVESFNA